MSDLIIRVMDCGETWSEVVEITATKNELAGGMMVFRARDGSKLFERFGEDGGEILVCWGVGTRMWFELRQHSLHGRLFSTRFVRTD